MAGPFDNLFTIFRDPSQGATNYPALETRRKLALAMMMQGGKKGFPKTLGEGLTAIGDAIGERGAYNELLRQEAAYQGTINKAAGEGAPAAAAPGPQASLAPVAAPETPVAAAAPEAAVAAADNAPPEEGGYNFIDAQAGGRFRPTPGYLQDAIAAREPSPDMQAYYGSLSGSEAKNAQDVSSTGAAGPYQFTQGTGARYGVPGAARMDPGASTDAVRAFTADNAAAFQRANGRPPTYQELAIMHQQGAGGGMDLLAGRSTLARNLAVNNMAGFSPGAAVAKMNGFYGMPNQVASVGGAPPDTAAADAAGGARLNDVVGMEKGDTGAYAQTASRGDIQSDAPDVGLTGTSAKTGAAAADTMMQARDQLAKRLIMQQMAPTAPGVPPPNPTQPGAASLPPTSMPISPAAAGTQPDIQPFPVAGAQMAQAMPLAGQMPPAIPPAGTPAPPVPQAPSVGRIPIPPGLQTLPTEPTPPRQTPKSPEQLYYEKMSDVTTGDPYLGTIYKNKADRLEQMRAFQDMQNKATWDAQRRDYEASKAVEQQRIRDLPKTELELQKLEDERQQRQYSEGITRQLGGIKPETFEANLTKSQEGVANIPAVNQGIQRAKSLVDKMYHGPFADTETFLAKVMPSFGLPLDPRASATEQFKTAMTNIMAQNRRAIVGAGPQSEAELKLLQQSTAADAKLTPETIKASLDAAERLNLQTVLQHQQMVRRYAGETDPQRQGMVYGTWGVPNSALVDMVPQASVDKLFKFSDNPQVHRDFDATYHTPGLSRDILRFRRPQ